MALSDEKLAILEQFGDADTQELVAEIRRLRADRKLADYDLKALHQFKGNRDKVLRYWATRAITAELQLSQAGIERHAPSEVL